MGTDARAVRRDLAGHRFIPLNVEQVAQRGYCINGRIMTAKAFCLCTPGVWS